LTDVQERILEHSYAEFEAWRRIVNRLLLLQSMDEAISEKLLFSLRISKPVQVRPMSGQGTLISNKMGKKQTYVLLFIPAYNPYAHNTRIMHCAASKKNLTYFIYDLSWGEKLQEIAFLTKHSLKFVQLIKKGFRPFLILPWSNQRFLF